MSKIASFLILFSFLACNNKNATTEFKITGIAEGMNGARVNIQKYGKILDSVIVDDGVFTLKANLPDLELCTILVWGRFSESKRSEGHTGWAWNKGIFVEKGATYKWILKGDDKYHKIDTLISSSFQHQQFERLEYLRKNYFAATKKKVTELEMARDYHLEHGNMDEYRAYSDSITAKTTSMGGLSQVRNAFYLANPNTYATIHALSDSHTLKQDFDVYKTVYDKLAPEFREHKYARIYKDRSDKMEKLLKGAPIMVDISGEDGKGTPFDFANYSRYKLIYLDIWASWCEPCRDLMPAAKIIQEKLFYEGVMYAFVSIDHGKTRQAWSKLNSSLDLYHSYLLDEHKSKEFQHLLAIESIPRYVIIRNDGKLLEKDAPGPDQPEELMALIEKLKSKQRL